MAVKIIFYHLSLQRLRIHAHDGARSRKIPLLCPIHRSIEQICSIRNCQWGVRIHLGCVGGCWVRNIYPPNVRDSTHRVPFFGGEQLGHKQSILFRYIDRSIMDLALCIRRWVGEGEDLLHLLLFKRSRNTEQLMVAC